MRFCNKSLQLFSEVSDGTWKCLTSLNVDAERRGIQHINRESLNPSAQAATLKANPKHIMNHHQLSQFRVNKTTSSENNFHQSVWNSSWDDCCLSDDSICRNQALMFFFIDFSQCNVQNDFLSQLMLTGKCDVNFFTILDNRITDENLSECLSCLAFAQLNLSCFRRNYDFG